MTQPRPSESLPLTREAARLGAFARGLGCSVGIERSCKLSPGKAEAGRFLLSYGADERTARLTQRLLADLEAPDAVRSAFEEAAPGARFLHLGHEGGAAPTLKVYCETDPDMDGPLYVAWKWSSDRPGVFAVDDYHLRGMVTAGEASAGLEEAVGDPALSGPCATLLARAEHIMMLEVRRRGAARLSYDLRLHGDGLTVADARPVISAARAVFGLDAAALRPLEDAGSQALGHLAAGRDDLGQSFLTLYYGAQEFA